MRVLVIADVHLKPWMFKHADELMQEGAADRAVCLMDLPDDFDQQANLSLYTETFDAAIAFAKKYPDTLWCYGNHDLCYRWNQRESGYSPYAHDLVVRKLEELENALEDENRINYVQKIDNVLFCHGGITESFVQLHCSGNTDGDSVVNMINQLSGEVMWRSSSPLWYRPQYTNEKMYGDGIYLQVVGHTPVAMPARRGNVISCDVFSTFRDHSPIGTQEFLVIDTETFAYEGTRSV